MRNPQIKRLYFLLIPIIAFIIGYFIMAFIQSSGWEGIIFRDTYPQKLSFPKDKPPTSKVSGQSGLSSPEEVITMAGEASLTYEGPIIRLNCIQVGTYTSEEGARQKLLDLSGLGFQGGLLEDEVTHVVLAGVPDIELAEGLLQHFSALNPDIAFTIQSMDLKPQPVVDVNISQYEALDLLYKEVSLLLERACRFTGEGILKKHTSKESRVFVEGQLNQIKQIEALLDLLTVSSSTEVTNRHMRYFLENHQLFLSEWQASNGRSQQEQWKLLLDQLAFYPLLSQQ